MIVVRLQVPKIMPETVLSEKVPTLIADELAVPARTVLLAPKVMVPSVSLLIVSPLRSVTEVVVAPPSKVLRPVTERVPSVWMLVEMVVAALTSPVTKNTDTITAKANVTGPRERSFPK